jgi:hypothetical protein
MDQEALLRKVLACELHYSKLWLVCVSLRGVSWDKMAFEQREIIFQAREAATNVLSIFLTSPEYRYVWQDIHCYVASLLFFSSALHYDMPYMIPLPQQRSQASCF